MTFKIIPFNKAAGKESNKEINFILDYTYNILLDQFDIIWKNLYKKYTKDKNLLTFIDNVKKESENFSFTNILFEYYSNNNLDINNLYKAMHNIVYTFSSLQSVEEQEISFFLDFLSLLDNTIKKNFITYSLNLLIQNADSLDDRDYIYITHTILKGRRLSTFTINDEKGSLLDNLKTVVEEINKKIIVKGKSLFSNTLRTYTKTNQYIFYKTQQNEVNNEINFELIENINTEYAFNTISLESNALNKSKTFSELLADIHAIIEEETTYDEKVNTLSALFIRNKNLISKNEEKITDFAKRDTISFYLNDIVNIFFNGEQAINTIKYIQE